MDLVLWQTAQDIRADPASRACFQAHDAPALSARYLDGALPAVAQNAIDRFMRRYGVRGLGEIDLGRPRWREEPQPILQSLQGYLAIADPDQAPDAVYARGRRAAEDEIERLAAALRGTRGGRLKAALVRWAARRMRALIGLREAPKFTMVRVFGLIRSALLAEGARLADQGLLDCAGDVFYLHLRELEALGAGATGDWAARVQCRRESVEREQARRQIPRLLLSDGQAFYGGARGAQEQGGAAQDAAVLYGAPVSPGVVEGQARVVYDPRATRLLPGEILVCPGTDPSWTPLFLAAGGLVMEVGGMMTHGAVVAREYGLPAVVGVRGATGRLHTGQRLRVNGSTGEVLILDFPTGM
jgi:pyruvate,water dikinase